MNKTIKKLGLIILILTLLQVLRFAFKKLVYIFLPRTLLSDVLIGSIYMLIITCIMCIVMIRSKKDLDIFPKKYKTVYIALGILLLALIISTPFISGKHTLFNILSLVYNAVITVVYEELIFRGFIWKELKEDKSETFAYILSSILFGLWHIGYIDTVIWRVGMFNPGANILNIMFWKVITGLILGIIFAFLRYKGKNVLASIIFHSIINTIGC